MWYGNAREDDMDYGQFCIMFRSIFLEGFARPFKGVRLILRALVRRFRSLGGELKLRSGVARIKVEGDRAVGVVLDNGQELHARRILSSAGIVETQRLCDDISERNRPAPANCRLSNLSLGIANRPIWASKKRSCSTTTTKSFIGESRTVNCAIFAQGCVQSKQLPLSRRGRQLERWHHATDDHRRFQSLDGTR